MQKSRINKIFTICLSLIILSGCYSVIVENKDVSYEFFLLLKSANTNTIENFLDDQSNSKRKTILNNSGNPYGLSSVSIVILEKRPELIAKLIEYGADVNAIGVNGSSALHIASSLGNLETVKELIEQYKAKMLADNEGQTPIHYASLQMKSPVLEYLVKNYQDMINDKDNKGNNALFYAVSIKDITNINVLLAGKSNASSINLGKETPLSYAQKMNYDSIVTQLNKKAPKAAPRRKK